MLLNNYASFPAEPYDIGVKLTFDLFEINCLHSTILEICETFCPYHL